MAPIRRYLRISKYSVLECRIFLENPADGPRWLLNPQDPALARVFEAVRPLVLPKLREENERAKGKGKKKKSVKDVVKQDDFEVSIFLTEIGTRHSLLVKSKAFKEKGIAAGQPGGLTGQAVDPVYIQEESDDDARSLAQIPSADSEESGSAERPAKRAKQFNGGEGVQEDKKKLGFTTSYEGFSIWGWVLCLLVERKGVTGKKSGDGHAQALMQEWITSTQQQQQDDEG